MYLLLNNPQIHASPLSAIITSLQPGDAVTDW